MLQPGSPEYEAWLSAMMGTPPPAPQPLSIDVPEYGSMIPTSPTNPPPQPPPPPPPPPPQKLGPEPIAPAQELPQPELPLPDVALPTPDMGLAAPQPVPATATGSSQPVVPLDPKAAQAAISAPPEPTVDAISGGDIQAAPTPGQVGGLRTEWQPGMEGLSTEEILKLTPEQRAKYDADRASYQQDLIRKDQAEAAKRDAMQAEEDLRTFQDSQAKAHEMTQAAMADAEALANWKPKKFTDDPWNVFSSVTGILFGMVGAPATGGKNAAFDVVQKRIDDFATEQLNEYNRKAGNVDRKLNMAARLKDAGYNDYQVHSAIRLAALQRAQNDAITRANNFDVKGSGYMQAANAIQQTQAAMAKLQRDIYKSNLDTAQKQATLAKTQAEVNKLNAEAAKTRGAMGGGGASAKAEDMPRPPEHYKALYPNAPVPPMGMSEKQYRQWLGTTSAGAEASQKLGAEAPEAARVRQLGIGDIKNPDGSPVLASNETEAIDLRKQKGAVDTINDFVGQIERGIRDEGGASKYFSSKAWSKQTARKAAITQAARDLYSMGALDEGAVKEADKLFGAIDPTSYWLNAAPGLRAGRDAAVAKFNYRLSTLPTNNGATYDPVYAGDLPEPSKEPTDEIVERVLGAQPGGEHVTKPTGPVVSGGQALLATAAQEREQTQRDIDTLVDKAKLGDKAEAEKARAALQKLAAKATSPVTKQMIDAALMTLYTGETFTEAASKEIPR